MRINRKLARRLHEPAEEVKLVEAAKVIQKEMTQKELPKMTIHKAGHA